MTTKTITGAYPGGYYLKPSYSTLDIAATASVGGAGVTASATQASTVNNLGTVNATVYGVSLLDGGAITNGSATNMTALIEGSAHAPGGGAGILVSGAVGTVVNFATIVETALFVGGQAYYGAAIRLLAGGSVTNGSASNTAAQIEGGIGVYVKGGAGTVVNYATIKPVLAFSAVTLEDGGRVNNGSAADTTAVLYNGVQLANASGTVVNYGTITQTSLNDGHGSNLAIGVRVFSAGGAIINGSATDAHATISGVRGIETTGALGGGPLTVTNFGTIASSGGPSKLAILFDSGPVDSLIEEGTGVIIGLVTGNGGVLELGAAAGTGTIGGIGGSITGFHTIEVDAGAGWHLTGDNEIAAGVTLSNAAAIVDDGVLTNYGFVQLGALLQLTTGAQLVNTAGGTIRVAGNTPISSATGATGTGFVNAGVLQVFGSGTTVVRTDMTDSGTIQVPTGTLELAGAVNMITGALGGTTIEREGTIDLHSGTTTLESGATVVGLTLEITGPAGRLIVDTALGTVNEVVATTQTELTIAAGVSLDTGVNFTGNTVDGAGTLIASGTISDVTLGGTVRWNNPGPLVANGKLTIGDADGDVAVFFNESRSIFDITGNSSITVGANKTSHFSNAGLLEKTGGTGLSVVTAEVANSGTIEVLSGTLDLAAAVGGGGKMRIGAGTTMEFGAAVAAAGTVTFAGGGGTLQLNNAEEFKASVAGFAVGETLDVRGVGLGATPMLGYSGTATSGVLTLTNGKHVATIALLGQYAAANFATASDGHGGVDITFVASPAPAAMLAMGH